MSDSPFFSIIVPAHNEEYYIEATLRTLVAQEYPPERFEVIVVENGSNDRTAEIASSVLALRGTVVSFPQKGVAFARNRGLEAARLEGDWIIFLDADSHLLPTFLSELAAFVSALSERAVVGSTSVEPDPPTWYSRAWFFFFNFFHRLLGKTFATVIVRHSALSNVSFDESLAWMEDVRFADRLMRRGTFFFMATHAVTTSTRRYRRFGWWRLLFSNIVVGLLPEVWQRRLTYTAVR